MDGDTMQQTSTESNQCSSSCTERQSIFLCSHATSQCFHGNGSSVEDESEIWYSDNGEGSEDDALPLQDNSSDEETVQRYVNSATQTEPRSHTRQRRVVKRAGTSTPAYETSGTGSADEEISRSWVEMVEEQEIMEELNKKGAHDHRPTQNLNGCRLTDCQQARLAYLVSRHKFPSCICYHLKNIMLHYPALLAQYCEFSLNHFASQTPIVMKRALLRWESYDLDKFRNGWDLLHVCVLHALHEQ
ncbi:uncharacterized protein LOC100369675 [Saccoglossus kowalevskii]|uniref:Uncharacterized protein LOC100369675 n=1 Tax=Saccoglossus kowalevskii TaxID=10224 RepID=A0ABM0MJQ0_SACKO|nr:PREDICTED: uncharacterized protein LOC100369675 [Saccoglossus kowalevskii]